MNCESSFTTLSGVHTSSIGGRGSGGHYGHCRKREQLNVLTVEVVTHLALHRR